MVVTRRASDSSCLDKRVWGDYGWPSTNVDSRPPNPLIHVMRSDGLRAEHGAGGCYGSRPAMKPGVDWQDRFHGIEMFQQYPNGPVGRPWKPACDSRESLLEPIEPFVLVFKGGSGLQANDENQPDVVLVRNVRADARNRVRYRIRQRPVSTRLGYDAGDFQRKEKIILRLLVVDNVRVPASVRPVQPQPRIHPTRGGARRSQ